jgi:hypothetical protein
VRTYETDYEAGQAGPNQAPGFDPAGRLASYEQRDILLVYPPRTNKGADPLANRPTLLFLQLFAKIVALVLSSA